MGVQWTENPVDIDIKGYESDLIWAGNQFIVITDNHIITSPEGLIWTTHTIMSPTDDISNIPDLTAIAYSGESYVAVGTTTRSNEIVIYNSLDAIHWVQSTSKLPKLSGKLTDVIWTGNEFLAVGNRGVVLTSLDGKEWVQQITKNTFFAKIAVKGTDIVGISPYNGVIVHSKCSNSSIPTYNNFVSDDLWVRAIIDPSEKGYIEAVWQQQGEELTSRGDRVIWGYFYASPTDVDWGSPNNPDVFVKIWIDVSGRVDVNYFHVSVPSIYVSTGFNNNTAIPNEVETLDTTQRYVHHSFNADGTSQVETNQEDGISPANYPLLAPNLTGYSETNDLTIGTLINTESAGIIEGTWQLGGQSTTARGDEVMWGHFYANPTLVDWGSPNNPDLFVKIWLDVSGRIDVNYFHVSVPDIGVYSDYPANGVFDQQGITILNDRYTRHEFSQVIKVTQ